MSFQIIPAIDLIGGQVVRLTQGQRKQATYYEVDPAKIAREFSSAGSQWIHVVNLDGAFDMADGANQRALSRIAAVQVLVQFGGGLRTLPDMQAAHSTGVDRLVLGTVALKQPDILQAALAEFGPNNVAVAVDLRGGVLQSHGWTEGTDLQLEDFLDKLASQSVEWIIYTDADRDGTGRGLALEAARTIQEKYNFQVIVSGGVGSLDDIRNARQAQVAGVIVGKALHDGKITIEEALAC